jgi:hypothetical protein
MSVATRRPLYFHFIKAPEGKTKFRPHTFCVRYVFQSNDLCIGYAVANKKDHFSRAIGRKLALSRALSIEQNDENHSSTFSQLHIHQDVRSTISYVIDRAKTILKLNDLIQVRCFSVDIKGATSSDSKRTVHLFNA